MKEELTQEQDDVLHGVMRRVKDRVTQTTVGGLAGSGKSVLMGAIRDRLRKEGMQVTVCAPTGKAVDVLHAKGMDEATTLHSQFNRMAGKKMAKHKIIREDGTVIEIETVEEMLWKRKKPDYYDVLLVDESSMVGGKIYKDVMAVGRPVVYVGDHGQLPPVSKEVVNVMADPDFRLEYVHRHAGDIARFAHHLRQGRDPVTFACRDGSVIFSDVKEAEQVICGTNRSRLNYNRDYRKVRGWSGPVQVGERLVSLKNAPKPRHLQRHRSNVNGGTGQYYCLE